MLYLAVVRGLISVALFSATLPFRVSAGLPSELNVESKDLGYVTND